nr:1877_t:CDS:2 [Entrophospora candida]
MVSSSSSQKIPLPNSKMSFDSKLIEIIHDNKFAAPLLTSFAVIGALFFSLKSLSFLRMLYDVYVRPGKSLKHFGAGKDTWAVITGASDGIGKEFALQLAEAKFNVLLISRTLSKLQDLSSEIESKYNVKSKVYPMNFARGDPKDYENLKNIIKEFDVGVLINNVGTNHDIPTPFTLESDEVIHDIVEVNIASLLKITKIVLPQMLPNNKGLIINIGSFSGMIATPYLSVYSGSKSFMNTWSQALGTELKSKGIIVENVNTYFVVSAMSKIRRSSFLVPLPKPYVKSVLSKIGVAGGASYVPFNTNVFPSHALANWLITNTFSWSFWVKKGLAQQEDIRKRALRKREREAATTKSQ